MIMFVVRMRCIAPQLDLRYTLVKLFDRAGQYAKAVAELTKANKLSLARVPSDYISLVSFNMDFKVGENRLETRLNNSNTV